MSDPSAAFDQLQRAKGRWKFVAISALSALAVSWMLGFVLLVAVVMQAARHQQTAAAARMQAEQAMRQAMDERERALRAEQEAAGQQPS